MDNTRILHILIVGVTQEFTAALTQDLHLPGRHVEYRAVVSMAEAHSAILESQPDAVVMDLELPNGKGLALIERMREACGQAIPIIIVTALQDEPINLYFESGADGFVEKSSSPRQLSAVVYRSLTQGAQRQHKRKQWQTMSALVSRLDTMTGKLTSTEAVV